jgi:hypothetical protein
MVSLVTRLIWKYFFFVFFILGSHRLAVNLFLFI